MKVLLVIRVSLVLGPDPSAPGQLKGGPAGAGASSLEAPRRYSQGQSGSKSFAYA